MLADRICRTWGWVFMYSWFQLALMENRSLTTSRLPELHLLLFLFRALIAVFGDSISSGFFHFEKNIFKLNQVHSEGIPFSVVIYVFLHFVLLYMYNYFQSSNLTWWKIKAAIMWEYEWTTDPVENNDVKTPARQNWKCWNDLSLWCERISLFVAKTRTLFFSI